VFRIVRMIATATITLWAATAAAQNPATPGKEPASAGSDVTTGSPGTPPAVPPQPAQAAPTQPAQPAVPPASAPPPAGATGTPATVLDTQDYDGVLGKAVRSSTGEDMGRIIDIILDKDGRPRAAIIDFGGFLGVGSRKIAVDWRAMRFTSDGKPSRLVLQLSRNQVRVSPEYKPGEPIVVLGPASPATPAEGEQAAAPVQGPPAPAPASAPQPASAPAAVTMPAPGAAPAPTTLEKAPTTPEKAPDKPAEKSPDR
jgi:hypothetical protein